jgi:hypothetical protein
VGKNLKEEKLEMIRNIIISKLLQNLKDHNTTKNRLQLKNQDITKLEKQNNIINGLQLIQAKEVMVMDSMGDNITEIIKKKKMFPGAAATLIFELTQQALLNGINDGLQQIITVLNLHLETKKTLYVNKNQKRNTNDNLMIVQKVPNKKTIGILEITEVKVI